MNLYEIPPALETKEWVDIIQENDNTRIERIISHGQTTDWLIQPEAEFVALLAGTAKLEYSGGQIKDLHAGDTLLIPADKKHRVAYTSSTHPCIWLCFFFSE